MPPSSSTAARPRGSDSALLSIIQLFFRIACFPIYVTAQIFSLCTCKPLVQASCVDWLTPLPVIALTLALSILPRDLAELFSQTAFISGMNSERS
jgi:hypothetical protein